MNNLSKKAIVAAAVMLISSTALAYENKPVGFSVRDGKPFATISASNVYGFLSGSDAMHAVSYYDAGTVEQLTGEKFSTAFFNETYDKLALLQRSGLNLETIPMPVLDLTKYAADENSVFGEMYKSERPMQLRIDKIGRYKAISYICPPEFADADDTDSKDEPAVCITLVSANDRLYILHTVASSDKPKDVIGGADGSTSIYIKDEEPSILRKDKQAAEAARDKEERLTKAQDEAWKQHVKFVKGFKTFAPEVKNSAATAFGYYDKVAGKTMQLPDNWLNTQINFDEQSGAGSVNVAAPIPMLRRFAAMLDEEYGLDVADDLTSAKVQTEFLANIDRNTALGRKMMQDFDKLLITVSYKDDKGDIADLFKEPHSLQLEIEGFLSEGIRRMQQSNMDPELFLLHNYKYNVDITRGKGLVDLWANYDLFKEHNLNSTLRAAFNNDKMLLMLYMERSGAPSDAALTKSIDQWQF